MTSGEVTPSIYDDQTFVANDQLLDLADTRIVGGEPTTDFPDCVAVGSAQHYCCTGTLIAPGVVLTAGHCVAHGCGDRIFIGSNIDEQGVEIGVREAIMHPDYVPNSTAHPFDDIAVLLLAEAVRSVDPAPICSAEALAAARTVRLVGFGNTDPGATFGYGIKRMADVGIAAERSGYGARFETEFVAGELNLDRDTCTGDSGGPAYVFTDGRWELAGATSRGTREAHRSCGDGGVYTRVVAYRDWLEVTAGPLG